MKKLLFIMFSLVLTMSSQANELVQYNLRVDGMTCPFCLAASEQALIKLDGVEHINSNLKTATISVCGPASLEFDEQELDELFKKKGFTYRSLEKLQNCALVDNADELKPLEYQSNDSQEHHDGHDHEGHNHEGHKHD